ncbi:MAG: hypothetical protein RM338_04195 [Nostoc sp. DedQUE12a]|nr:hypothetical protein [Nostoc sp. DedQUE12a]
MKSLNFNAFQRRALAIELLATYPNREELRQVFPELEDEDIQQALIFASSYMSDRIIELPNRYEAVTVEPSRIRIRRLAFLPDV